MNTMHRRDFLFQTVASPLLLRDWGSGIPRGYLAEIEMMMRAASVPGVAIGAVRRFEPAWTAVAGVRAAGAPAKITASTLFQAASLTKQVTAQVALALHDKGRLDLDAPLVNLVDDLRDANARTVTARHVLSHSSGFPNWRFAKAGDPPPDLAPEFAPGSRYRYSGEGYFYLQRVIEQITGVGIGQAAHDFVFAPLRMTSSALVWDPATLDSTALPHDRRGEPRKDWDRSVRALHEHAAKAGKPVRAMRYAEYAEAVRASGNPVLPNWIVPNGAASMVTNAEDYARFLAGALRNPRIAQQQVSINEFLGWGLGWAVERAAGRTYVWQWGDNGGFKNFVLGEPATGDGLFVFTNGDGGQRIYDRVIVKATGHEHPALLWL